MRIEKLLATMGFGSRNEIKKMIRKESVFLNGVCLKQAGVDVDPLTDCITVNGIEVQYQPYQYFMLHKPAGYISATQGNEPTVMDLVGEPYKDLFPCGRLDKDTEGLLLITNDGQLAHRLLSPKHHVEKEYYVEVDKPLQADCEEAFEKGIRIDEDTITMPARLIFKEGNRCRVIIQEGKFHQIKRMFEALGYNVLYLRRLRMKNLVLDENLQPGEYRPLTEEEIKDLWDFDTGLD